MYLGELIDLPSQRGNVPVTPLYLPADEVAREKAGLVNRQSTALRQRADRQAEEIAATYRELARENAGLVNKQATAERMAGSGINWPLVALAGFVLLMVLR